MTIMVAGSQDPQGAITLVVVEVTVAGNMTVTIVEDRHHHQQGTHITIGILITEVNVCAEQLCFDSEFGYISHWPISIC